MAVKLKEIAVLAGVSQPAVSAVLNKTSGGVRVSKEKSQQIKILAEELGYVANYAAQKLRGRHTPTIGIIGGRFDIPMQTVLINQLMLKFSNKGYFVLLGSNIDEKNKMKHDHIAMRELLSRGIDGAILIGSHSQKTRDLLKLPCVILRDPSPGEPFDYNIDSKTGIFLAVKHLIEHGHKKIIIAGPRNQTRANDIDTINALKYAGAEMAFKKAGIPLEHLKALGLANNQKELLRLINDEAFTALVSTNDFTAGRIMSFLQSNDISIPKDFAVIGYNGSAFTQFTSPPLTTVVQTLKLMADKAFKLLLHRIENSENGIENSRYEMLVPHLSIAGSCGCKAQPLCDWASHHETVTLE